MKLGVSFHSETGSLRIVEPEHTTVLRGWPAVAAVRSTADGPSGYHYPRIRVPAGDLRAQIHVLEAPETGRRQLLLDFMVSPSDRESRRAEIAWLRWCQLIPTTVREVVTSFHRDHWAVLSFLARCGSPALDLATSNPALAFALVNGSRLRAHRPGTTLRAAQALLEPGRKQREILGWLGFPPTEPARRILAKVPPGAVSTTFLARLRRALRDPVVAKALSRLPRVNTGALGIAATPSLRDNAHLSLLIEVGRAPEEDRRAPTARRIARAIRLADRYLGGTEGGRRLRSRQEVTDVHRGLVAVDGHYGPEIEGVTFPRPPVAGIETIVPITTPEELIREGWSQHHCSARYVRRVARDQDAYFYKVLAPERCTLMLEWVRHDWVAGEIRSACNGEVSLETLEAVRDWMARSTGLPPAWTMTPELRRAMERALGPGDLVF